MMCCNSTTVANENSPTVNNEAAILLLCRVQPGEKTRHMIWINMLTLSTSFSLV